MNLKTWNINRFIVILLTGGFAVLLLEIRFLHRGVLAPEPEAWTPIIYAGLMLVAGLMTLFAWGRGIRRFLFYAFAAGLIVGLLGFYFHNEGQIPSRVGKAFMVWGDTSSGHTEGGHEHKGENRTGEAHSSESGGERHGAPGEAGGGHSSTSASAGGGHAALQGPPIFSPLTFFGLGLLGMLACAERFQAATGVRNSGEQ